MIAWADVLRWDPAPLNNAAGELNTRYEKLLGSAEELRASGTPRGWVGGASDTAREKNWRLRDEAELWAAEIAAVRRATGDVADAMIGVVEGREEALSLAQRRNFTITEDGTVVDSLLPLCLDVSPAEQAEIEEERARIAKELEFRVSELLRQAADIDHDYCLVLDRVLSGHIIDAENNAEYTTLSSAGAAGTKLGMLSVLKPPPPDAPAAQNAAYWAGLSNRQQAWMARTYPERIGGRGGIDAKHRSIANRVLLDRAQARFKDRIAELRAENAANLGPGGRSTRLPNQREIWDLQHKIEALDALERLTEDVDGDPLPSKQLLVLDTSGDEVHGAVANGNVDTADHVAVFTPGMNSDIGENFAGYVADMQDVRYLAEKQLNAYGHGGSVATVTWLGYTPPSTDNLDSLGGVLTGDVAEQGAGKLAEFYEGINASRAVEPHMTALGHSYGSLTQGIALTSVGSGVDDAVFFGSPGIASGPASGSDGIAALELDGGAAYNLEAEGDKVADVPNVVPRYGGDLAEMEGMHQLSTAKAVGADGMPLVASHGHSEYTMITPDGRVSTSMYNVANVVAGMSERTVPVGAN